jgi:hypothetical protein
MKLPSILLDAALAEMRNGASCESAAAHVKRTASWLSTWIYRSKTGLAPKRYFLEYQEIPHATCDMCGGGIPRKLRDGSAPSKYKTVENIKGNNTLFVFCCAEHKKLWDTDTEATVEPKYPKQKVKHYE